LEQSNLVVVLLVELGEHIIRIQLMSRLDQIQLEYQHQVKQQQHLP